MGFRTGDETIEIDGDIEAETAKAVLFRPIVSDVAKWIPKSQIVDRFEASDDTVTLRITMWIARKNGYD